MKISCQCGALIVDQTDYLPWKAYLIPDQEWFATWDAIDEEVVGPVADGRMDRAEAYHQTGEIIDRSARSVWQCRECGRLYIDDLNHQLRCFVPEGEPIEREILRSKPSPDPPVR